MGKIKESIQQIYDDCYALYEKGGVSAVCDHVIAQQNANNPMYEDVKYKYCTGCEAGQPNLNDVCLVCGSSTIDHEEKAYDDAEKFFKEYFKSFGYSTQKDLINCMIAYVNSKTTEIPKKNGTKELRYGDRISTIGQLREIIANLDDHDLICNETIDLETGDVHDLYPLYVDVIEGIKLTDNTIVREVRFCQMPNTDIPKKNGTRPNYFEINAQGWNEGLQREEVQIHCGENGNLMIVKTDEGFVVDAYDVDGEHIDTMAVWEDDINPPVEEFTNGIIKKHHYLQYVNRKLLIIYVATIKIMNKKKDFTAEEIAKFKEDYGCPGICEDYDPNNKPNTGLMEDNFWIEADKKWYDKHSPHFTIREQLIADYLRNNS